jgi:hypothetical protein
MADSLILVRLKWVFAKNAKHNEQYILYLFLTFSSVTGSNLKLSPYLEMRNILTSSVLRY